MADKFKILTRENRRFILFERDYWEICRDLAAPLAVHETAILGDESQEASKAVCRAAASFLSYLEQKTEFIINGEGFDTEERIVEVERARRGEDSGRLWWKASYGEIAETGLIEQYGRTTVIAAIKYTIACGLVDRRAPERTERKTNESMTYRLRVDRLDHAIRLLRRRELAAEWSFPEPTVTQGHPAAEGVSEATSGVSETGSGVSEPDPGVPDAGDGGRGADGGVSRDDRGPYPSDHDLRPPDDHQDLSAAQDPVSTQTGAGLSQAPVHVADDLPIYGGTNDKLGTEGEQDAPSTQAVDAFADQLCQRLADLLASRRVPAKPDDEWLASAGRVISLYPAPEELPGLISFSQGHRFWSKRITDMPAFEKNLRDIAADFHPPLEASQAALDDYDKDIT